MTSQTVGLGTTRTRDRVAAQLEEELLASNPAPGTKLPSERQLATRLGVSRPLVREALRSLVTHGLIEIVPGRGAFVRAASSAHASRPLQMLYRRRQVTPRDLIEARLMIEPAAVALACERAQEDDLAALEFAIGRFDLAADPVEMARWDVTAHALIARMSNNPVIEATFGSLTSLLFELMLRSLTDSDVLRQGGPIHHEIAKAIRARDAERGREAMVEHLEVARYTYGADLDESLDLVARREIQRLLGPSITLESILENVAVAHRPLDSLETEEILRP
jgi:GntR family transcriptional repressor for pyruvate dehydrogenase complex